MSELANTDPLRVQLERVARHLGARRTADELGVSRESLLGVIAGMPVRPGTLALLRERQHVLDALDKDGRLERVERR